MKRGKRREMSELDFDNNIDIECIFQAALRYAIEWHEDVIIHMLEYERDSDLMFKRAIQAYERGVLIKKCELV